MSQSQSLRKELISNGDDEQKTSEESSDFYNGHGRQNYLKWGDYFMSIALLAAQRSKDPCTQVGACIVNSEKKIVGIGYNGMPNDCDDSKFPWGKEGDEYNQKAMYVCHAEMNAILNKNTYDLKNCTIYVGRFPCNECAKIIIQSGIREVIYLTCKDENNVKIRASKRMFDSAKIKYKKYFSENKRIVIEFPEEKLTD